LRRASRSTSLVEFVRARLATATPQRVKAGRERMEIALLRITDAGRRELAKPFEERVYGRRWGSVPNMTYGHDGIASESRPPRGHAGAIRRGGKRRSGGPPCHVKHLAVFNDLLLNRHTAAH
jgi:hypothetical protein